MIATDKMWCEIELLCVGAEYSFVYPIGGVGIPVGKPICVSPIGVRGPIYSNGSHAVNAACRAARMVGAYRLLDGQKSKRFQWLMP